MKTLIATGWNFMRILRLIIGIVVTVFAIRSHDLLLGLGGSFLVLLAVLNAGCCGAGACSTGSCKVDTKTNTKE
ncbi:hypothetical protein [Niastella populi]|uniref:DUF2892 domain-containing protein n=1 Tax=Niastella populi TaxID=550983 RepID=A0A1V9FL23_9BACT|nr:hypothetical protein [Niastella populi]OQP59048.1 hypothetical protein A4R26_21920 [Niastella populi]